jgi:hypothetical protein
MADVASVLELTKLDLPLFKIGDGFSDGLHGFKKLGSDVIA